MSDRKLTVLPNATRYGRCQLSRNWPGSTGHESVTHAFASCDRRIIRQGLFEPAVPESEISLVVESDDFVQPCAVRSKVPEDVEVRIEMLPVSALNVMHAPLPQLSFEPSITGTCPRTRTSRSARPGSSHGSLGRSTARSRLSSRSYWSAKYRIRSTSAKIGAVPRLS